MTSPNPEIKLIELTKDELATRQIGSHNLQSCLEALHHDGIVVLKNAVDPSHLDKLNEKMVAEAKSIYERTETYRNFGKKTGNIQQEPVRSADYVFEDIIANPFATSVIESMIGPCPTMRFYSANTAFKATERQPVHIDVDFDMPHMPFAYCVNVNLVDTSPENGATEVWLGSHTDTDRYMLDQTTEYKQIRSDLLEERRRISPGIQPGLPKGSLMIRDFRLWHAGMPNRTDDPRVMLVSIQFASWYRSGLKVVLPRSLEGKVDWGRVVPAVEWVDDDYDYFQGVQDRDFSLLP
ncbi:uncharacterized protein N7511_009360 [Penicillium nucicola]|uniref:uncharacterized protein n=1 Tax=Penicillium nucicola TaxID=1850975 RepID=UPI002545473E|nr:uncharacterized protein N7511_009360 [Penicillium nucicola]KAJ5747664.1 hypothetical protein N7511_009360 [Penicillium nucicola]